MISDIAEKEMYGEMWDEYFETPYWKKLLRPVKYYKIYAIIFWF